MQTFLQKLFLFSSLLLSSGLYAQSDSFPKQNVEKGIRSTMAVSRQEIREAEEQEETDEKQALQEQIARQQTRIELLEQTVAKQELIIASDTPLLYEQSKALVSRDRELKEQKRKITLGTIVGSVIVAFLIAMQ